MRALQPYIGKMWAIPCDGISTFDCWELASKVREHFGKSTPIYVPPTHRQPAAGHYRLESHAKDWKQLDGPVTGCLATFGVPAHHCGVMVNETDLMHSAQGRGVQVNNVKVAERAFGPIRYWELRT